MERPGGIHPAILMNCAAQAALKFALVSKFYPLHPAWFLLSVCRHTDRLQKAALKPPLPTPEIPHLEGAPPYSNTSLEIIALSIAVISSSGIS